MEQDPYHCEISQKGWIPLPPIDFKDKGKEGIRLTDAMNLRFDGPDNRDDPMFEDGNIGNSVTSLGAEGVLPYRQIESLLRVCNQFAPTLPSG